MNISCTTCSGTGIVGGVAPCHSCAFTRNSFVPQSDPTFPSFPGDQFGTGFCGNSGNIMMNVPRLQDPRDPQFPALPLQPKPQLCFGPYGGLSHLGLPHLPSGEHLPGYPSGNDGGMV